MLLPDITERHEQNNPSDSWYSGFDTEYCEYCESEMTGGCSYCEGSHCSDCCPVVREMNPENESEDK